MIRFGCAETSKIDVPAKTATPAATMSGMEFGNVTRGTFRSALKPDGHIPPRVPVGLQRPNEPSEPCR